MVASKGANPDPATSNPKDYAHITQEMYKQNLELAERNKTLSLLRKIDELVLSPLLSAQEVAQQVVKLIVSDADFSLAVILVNNKKKTALMPFGIAQQGGPEKIESGLVDSLFNKSVVHSSDSLISQAHKTNKILKTTKLDKLFSQKLARKTALQIQREAGIRTLFICPLNVRWQSIGTLIIGSSISANKHTQYRHTLIERLTGVIGIAIDNKFLSEEIREATARLRVSNKRLKELDKAKDEFISMASHQLRTPLTAIKGYLSMLLEGDAGKVSDKQHQFIDLSFTSAQRMVYLISDMLNVSRINTGKLVIEPSPLNMETIIKSEIKQLERTAESRNVELEFKTSGELPTVNLDEGKIRQVIMNFTDNAIYYAPNSTVELRLERAGEKLRFTVVDHGIGVPKAAQGHLFTKFYRADNAQKSRPDGTGLGLYMAKIVVEMQGGTIIFTSAEGKGSTFGFEFDLDKIAVKKATAKPPATVPAAVQ